MSAPRVQMKYKDTIFCMIFKEKEDLLSLYNAVNETNHTDAEALEITTLENAIYMNYKNDISFVLDFELALYEHQSTVNANMPLRELIYVTKVIQGLISNKDLFSTKRISIPTPKFVVFYNGVVKQPEHQVLKLSDAYQKKVDEPELELMVTVLNINYGKNQKLMETCQRLREYAQYVELVREYAKSLPIEDAVEKAVEDCIRKNILADFLRKNRSEAIAMSIFEYDEEKHLRSEREIAFIEGREQFIASLLQNGKTPEEIAAFCNISIEEVQEIESKQ